jgi:MinD-like ATPase involved in chromosome partitioning or flagellar assembly
MAGVLANDSSEPVTLLECNWEHPCLHEHFGFSPTPGLAEWLLRECSETAIRHQVRNNLTVIPAGDGKQDAMKLLRYMRQRGSLNILGHSSELLVVDLPAILSAAYGLLAASLVESLAVVIRAGVTPDLLIAETCTQLKNLPVQGLILNQMESHVPRWIRQML